MVVSQNQPQELDMADDKPDDRIERDAKGHFAKGNRGGPGRPRSPVSRGAVALDEMGADAGKKIFQAMLDKALAGDTRAADLLFSRIWPKRRGRPVAIETTALKDVHDYVPAAAGVANAVMSGEMTPHEGQALSRVLDTQLHAIETSDMERRVRKLEDDIEEEDARREPFSGLYPTDSTTVFDGFPPDRKDEKA